MITKRIQKILYVILFVCTASPTLLAVENNEVNLHAETWDVPRHGEVLLRVPELIDIVKRWMARPQQIIVLRYPGGEEGELWVGELKDWLVSLGVASTAIQVTAGSDAEDVINMKLIEMP